MVDMDTRSTLPTLLKYTLVSEPQFAVLGTRFAALAADLSEGQGLRKTCSS